MKRNLILIAVLIAAAGFFVSCSEKDGAVSDTLSFETIEAEIQNPEEFKQTKTCVDGLNLNPDFIGLLWQPNDQIGVYSQDGKTRNVNFKCTSSTNVPRAEFNGEFSGTPYYAYFPYSTENDACDIASINGVLLAEQSFDHETGTISCDYKYGKRASDGTNKFYFKQLFSMLRVTIEATDTKLEGESLNNIVVSVTDANGNQRPICGDFTFSAIDGTWSMGDNIESSISMSWSKNPALNKGKSYQGFITIMPVVKMTDKIKIAIYTDNYNASFTADCKLDFQAGYVYDLPLKLSEIASNSDKYNYQVAARPALNGFSFNVSNNSGKLLDNKCTWNSSDKPQFSSVSSHTAEISGDNISLMIPYLYDFKLVPTFSVSEGGVVTANGKTIESGKTEVDFTNPVTFTVTAGEYVRNYTVNITNTGIPVVVLKQSGSGDFSEVTSGSIFNKVVNNKFVDFMIRGKDTDWVEDDQITVYNADGSVNLATTTCGARLRGNTSQAYPKKPFAVKLTSKAPILGMPAHKRWVLLANWLDHSMIRNTVAFDIAHAIENAWKTGDIEPGIPWNVHGQNVELVFVESDGTGHHVGNYLFCEQIKIDGNRLDIQDPYEDVTNPTLETCGYLFEIDNNYDEDYQFKTSNSVPVMFKDAMPDQTIFNAIKSKIQGIEDNLDAGNYSAAYEDLDIYSVIDQLIIWELTMNREYGDPRSVYYFMDGNNKLSAGPVWDFDRGTFQNTTNAASQGNSDRVKPYDQWMYWRTDESDGDSYIWYRQLAKDPIFKTAVQDRWKVIYPYLQGVSGQIRNYGETLKLSFDSDSAMWPTDKAAVQKHKSNFSDWSGDENLATFEEVIDNFVKVYEARLSGMNALIKEGKFTK